MNRLLKYLRLYFGISLILSMFGCIIIVISISMSFDGYTAYPIFEQKPYFFVVLQFIAQMISSIKVVFGTVTVSLIGFFIAIHFRRLYGTLREMV